MDMVHSLQISYIRIITLTHFGSGVQLSKNSVKNGINTRTVKVHLELRLRKTSDV